jgi:hypothetical protein
VRFFLGWMYPGLIRASQLHLSPSNSNQARYLASQRAHVSSHQFIA